MLSLPVISGRIDRRILLNYRVEPSAIRAFIPRPMRPKLIEGRAIAGLCLIRLAQLRPRGLPAWIGVGSENMAHRVAVEWDDATGRREGVYIWRRDTSSWFNHLAGGRIFPGVHGYARFRVDESDGRYAITVQATGEAPLASLRASSPSSPLPDEDPLPGRSIFNCVEQASSFFAAGSLGYSRTGDPTRLEGLELCCRNWRVQPLVVETAESRFFDDRKQFPAGTIELDSALLMTGIEHEWRSRDMFCCAALDAAGRAA